MSTNKRVFTLRLNDEVFDKIGRLASEEHRSVTNYIEFVSLRHIEEIEHERGEILLRNYYKSSPIKSDCFCVLYQILRSYIQIIQMSRYPVTTAARVKGTPYFMNVPDETS